ncbi:MAG: hypothetical protein N2234_01830 [Planctomycetota bacterium]|nr:hypothetical protein [Planctomycetota bacterium]
MQRVVIVFFVLVAICSCNIFRRKPPPPPPEAPKIAANSIALNISLEGEESTLVVPPFEEMVSSGLKARGFSVVSGMTQVTDLALEGKFVITLMERSQMYGPDKFKYRVSGTLKIVRRANGEVLALKELDLNAVQLGKEGAVQSVVKMAVETICTEVISRVIRQPGT